MNYEATIDFDDHARAPRLLHLRERFANWLYAGPLAFVAYWLARQLMMTTQLAVEAIEKRGLDEVLTAFDMTGMPWLPWLAMALVPVALYIVWFCARSAAQLVLPPNWQPGARGRLRRLGLLGWHRYTLAPDALVVQDRKGNVKDFPWRNYRGFKESDRGFYLQALPQSADHVLIPKSGCRTHADVNALRTALARHLTGL